MTAEVYLGEYFMDVWMLSIRPAKGHSWPGFLFPSPPHFYTGSTEEEFH